MIIFDNLIKYIIVLSKYLIKWFDNDKDGKISYWDLMANLYPIKKVNMILKKYSTKERRVSPPNVNIESYLDYNGEITAEEFSLWPEKLDPGLEYGLRRFIGRELKFYRRVCLFNQKFNNNLKKESKDSIKGKIDFSELFADLIQSKNWEDENPKSFNQKLSAKDIKSYIIDVTKDKIIWDNNLIKSIMRRLDRDQDGLVSLNDYTCAIQPLEADQNFLRDTVNKLIWKVKLDENTLFQKKMDKNFYEVEQAKNIAKKISSIGRPSKAKTDINDNKKLDYKDHKNINENEDDSKSIALTWSQLLKSGK